MAKIKGIKVAKKAPRRDPLFLDEAHVGTEPIWDTERATAMPQATFDRHLRDALRYYAYFYSVKDFRKLVNEWVKHSGDFTKQEIAAYLKTSDSLTPMTLCSLIRAHSKGMPMTPRVTEYAITTVRKVIEMAGDKLVVEETEAPKLPTTAKVLTIQERLAEKTSEFIAELEGEVDNAFTAKATAKIYDMLVARNVPQSQVGKIRANFERQFAELSEAAKGKDAQLTEGYSHLAKKDVKRITEFYTALFADLDSYTNVKKATKAARAPKVPSKEKLIAKVKYMKESKELKVVSVNPVNIIGATKVWVYQTKYRKLGCYIVDATAGQLGIKGTSIVGYDEMKSVAKTLRKPAEQIAEFMKLGKVALRTHLRDIKATETRLNGRLSEDVLILKVE